MIRSKTDTPVFQLSGLPGKNMLNLYSCTQKCGLALRECKMYVKCKPLHGEFAPVQTVFFTIIYMYKRTLLFTLLLASLQITKQTSKSVISTLFFFKPAVLAPPWKLIQKSDPLTQEENVVLGNKLSEPDSAVIISQIITAKLTMLGS